MAPQTAGPNPPKTLRIGVMLENVQLSDVLGIDIFGNMSKEYIDSLGGFDIPSHIAELHKKAIDIKFDYLSSTLEPTMVTPGLKIVPTATYDTCPRDYDIVLTGGPLLTHRPAAADRFIREAWPRVRVWLTTCVGSLWIASTGVMDGLDATTNREGLPIAKNLHPNVNWLDQRWVVVDKPYEGEGGGKGELWTAGGAGAGIDMIAHYVMQNYGEDFARGLALEPLQFDPAESSGQYYQQKCFYWDH